MCPDDRSCQPNSYTSWNLELLSGLDPKLLDPSARIGVVHETGIASWRRELPTLTARLVTLREPASEDLGPLVDLLSIEDASRFGIEEAIDEVGVQLLIDRAARDREAGAAFTYVVVNGSNRGAMGLVQVRALDPAFETAEWECTLAPSARGPASSSKRPGWSARSRSRRSARTGSRRACCFRTAAANGALRKLGAVQEGILRRSTRRRGEYVDQVLWSVLKDDWSDHWVATSPRVH